MYEPMQYSPLDIDQNIRGTPAASTVNYNQTYVLEAFETGSSTPKTVVLPSGTSVSLSPATKDYFPLAYVKLIPSVSSQKNQPARYGDTLYIQWQSPLGTLKFAGGNADCNVQWMAIASGNNETLKLAYVANTSSTVPIKEGDVFAIKVSMNRGGYGDMRVTTGGRKVTPNVFINGACNNDCCTDQPPTGGSNCRDFGSGCTYTSYTYRLVSKDGTISTGCGAPSDCPGGYTCLSGKCEKIIPPAPSTPGSGDGGGGNGGAPSTDSKTITRVIYVSLGVLAFVAFLAFLMHKDHHSTFRGGFKYVKEPI